MDLKEENDSKIISWCEDEKVVDFHLFVGSGIVEKIEENEKQGLNQKESDLSLRASTNKEIQVEFKDRDVDNAFNNGVMEIGAIKLETADVNEVATEELLNYDHGSTVKSESIKQEEIQIKYEEDNEDSLNEIKRKPDGNQLRLHQCPKCPYRTNYKQNLKKHSLRHKKRDEIDWYSCQECLYETSRQNELKLHAEIHKRREQKQKPTKTLHQCPECSYKTSRKYDLKCHAQTHDNNLVLKCLKCSYETFRPINFKKHQKKHKIHNVQQLHCFDCSYKTHKRDLLRKHVSTHRAIFKCPECPYQTGIKRLLDVHQVKHENKDKWHSCPLCSYKSYDKKRIKPHIRLRHRTDPDNLKHTEVFKCTECPYESGSKYRVKRHQVVHDQNKWLQCPVCAYKTPFKSYLREHQARHLRKNAELNQI